MKQKQKKINYCRLSLQGGTRNRMELSEDYRLLGSGGGSFSYLAPVFDTRDIKSTFHRFLLQGEFKDCKYEVIAAAVDSDISSVIYRDGITTEEQKEILRSFVHVRKVNKTDFLLHELEGRYLWIYIGVSAFRLDSSFTIRGFQVEFPKSSFLEYLPEVYQNTQDTFFYRYMAALQSLYVDLEAEIGRLPKMLDYESTTEDKLPVLAEWVGLDNSVYPFSPQQLRYMIGHLWELQAGKGTRRVLEQVLRLVTGRTVYLIEYFKWSEWMQESSALSEIFRKLYGGDESVFSVIIDFTREESKKQPDSELIMRQIEEYMPLGNRCNLVYLTESYHMDTHCYLDVNSYLSTPVTADTGGFVLGGNYILG